MFCVGAVQFVNILDFMMVMPLGPDFANITPCLIFNLHYPRSRLGLLGELRRHAGLQHADHQGPPARRARFSSIQSAVQHLASALGAFASAQFLVELSDKTLSGVPTMAFV